ncbi:MAG: hypothetical protein RLZ47_562 [Bacteroidota bacterium]|jgi:hypothetical protein
MAKFFSLALLCIFFTNCKKDNQIAAVPKAYNYITLNDIKTSEAKFSAEDITSFYSAGAVIFYKTTGGTYGKLRITDIDITNKKFSLELVNYDDVGKESLKKINIEILLSGGSADFDLDQGNIAQGSLSADFKWLQSGASVLFRPINNSLFYLYSD